MSKELELKSKRNYYTFKKCLEGITYVSGIESTKKDFDVIEQALNRLSMFEELFVKMDLELEIEIGDDSWGTSQDYGTYVRGENSTFEELYITDDDTVMLISKLKENEIETMYEDMASDG